MSEYPPVCRICLAMNVNLLPLARTPLQSVFEKLMTTSLHTADMRPVTACYICYTGLQKSHKLMLTSVIAENVLTEIVKRNSKITKRSVFLVDRKAKQLCGSLSISPPECIDSTPQGTLVTASDQSFKIKVEKEEPVLENLESVLEAVEPVLEAVEPVLEAVEPVLEAVEPVLEAVEPVLEAVEPVLEAVEPVLEAVEPVLEAVEPVLEDVKTEYVIEELEDSPLDVEFLNFDYGDGDNGMESNNTLDRVSETQRASVTKIKVARDASEPGTFVENPEHEKQATTGKQSANKKPPHGQHGTTNSHHTFLIVRPRPHSEKLYQCSVCHQQFNYSNSLKIHLRTHTGEKPYECQLCNRRFTCSHNVTAHLRTHTGETPYECGLCQRQFKRVDHLRRHMGVHTGEKPFECQFCEKRFTRQHHMESHLTIHTGEKSFMCNVCGHGFVSNYKLKTHLRKHTGEKPYECNICKRQFKQKESIKIHLMANDGEIVYECKICKCKFHYKRVLKSQSKTCKPCRLRSRD